MAVQVLIVDDEPRVAVTIALLLECSNLKCQVHTVASGEAAVDQLIQSPADVVITDYRMPGMDGLQLLAHLQENYPQTRAILLTAYAAASTMVKARELGVFRVLAKPFEIQELLTAVRQAMASG